MCQGGCGLGCDHRGVEGTTIAWSLGRCEQQRQQEEHTTQQHHTTPNNAAMRTPKWREGGGRGEGECMYNEQNMTLLQIVMRMKESVDFVYSGLARLVPRAPILSFKIVPEIKKKRLTGQIRWATQLLSFGTYPRSNFRLNFLDNGFPQVGTTQAKMECLRSSKKYFRFGLLFAELDSNAIPFLSGQFARCVGRKAPLLESSFTEEGYPQGMG